MVHVNKAQKNEGPLYGLLQEQRVKNIYKTLRRGKETKGMRGKEGTEKKKRNK